MSFDTYHPSAYRRVRRAADSIRAAIGLLDTAEDFGTDKLAAEMQSRAYQPILNAWAWLDGLLSDDDKEAIRRAAAESPQDASARMTRARDRDFEANP